MAIVAVMVTTSLLTAPSPRVVAEHTRFDPVFVLGHSRSGTSLMCRLLLDHLGVNFGTESQFIVRYHQKLAQYGDLSDDRRLRWLFQEISRERFFERTRRNFGFVFDIDRAMNSIGQRTYAGVLTAIFEQFACGQGLTRWGDKTPAYARHLPVLRELFPRAQYIHVVRDGRDAALSLMSTGFGPKTAYEAAVAWSAQVRDIDWLAETSSASNFLTVRYEDLLKQPGDVLGKIAAFLAIRNPDALAAAVSGAVRQQVREGNCAKWTTGLSQREIECFETYAGRELERFGYALAFSCRTKPVTRLESTCWRAQGIGRRFSNRRYWTDNCYKIWLRLREMTLPLRQPASLRPQSWTFAAIDAFRRRVGQVGTAMRSRVGARTPHA